MKMFRPLGPLKLQYRVVPLLLLYYMHKLEICVLNNHLPFQSSRGCSVPPRVSLAPGL